MSTLLQLRERVARDLSDPDNKTFNTDVVGDLIDLAMVEVSRIAPLPCREMIVPTTGRMEYPTMVREPSRLEVWEEADPEADVALAPSSATDDILDTLAPHGYLAGDAVRFSDLDGGAGLTEGTTYYVLPGLTSTGFQVALSQGGPVVGLTSNIVTGNVARVAGIPVSVLRHIGGEYVNASEAGWELWGGQLRITYATAAMLNEAHLLRLWGWRPRARLTALDQVAELDDNAEGAVLEYATYMGYDRLVARRALFTQWQTDSNNTDVSFTQVLSALNYWSERWNRRRKQLAELRATP